MVVSLQEIKRKLEESEEENYEHRYFVLFPRLRTVLSRSVISELLEQSGVDFYDLTELTKVIARGGLRLFGILIYIDAVSAVKTFQELDHSFGRDLDARLPLERAALEAVFSEEDPKTQFLKKQWAFLAPILRQDQSLRRLHENTILPLLDSKLVKRGGFGEVTKVIVKQAHHNDSHPEGKVTLVRKVLFQTREANALEEDFAHELHILSCLRYLKHPSLIQLVTAFTLGTSQNFILPQADGDLHDLLLSGDGMIGLRSGDELVQSLWGLSSALAAVHEYFAPEFSVRRVGCHYDIKPRNILCMRGRLMLSDFGLSRLVEEDTSSRTLFKQGEGCYLAPECQPSDRDFEPGKIGRASDIWSFGCVLSEILAYIDTRGGDGPSNVKQYRAERRIQLTHITGNYFHSNTDVNPQVIAFLESFGGNQEGVPMTYRLLARTILETLQFRPEERPKVSYITQSLFCIPLARIYRNIVNERFEDPEVAIEIKSLELWADAVGLTSPTDHLGDGGWLRQPHGWQELQEVADVVENYWQEIQLLKSQGSSISKPGFSVCYNLRRLGDQLLSLLPRSRREYLKTRLEDYILGENMEGVPAIDVSNEPGPAVNNHQIERIISLRRVALLNTTRKIVESEESSSNKEMIYNLEALDRPFEKFHAHYVSAVTHSGIKAFIEILNYQEDWQNRVPELQHRVRSIASMRNHSAPSEIFPILHCDGYYHNMKEHSFGLVYGLPPLAANTKPLSLLEIIDETSSRAHQPSLTQKFKLAHLLVSYVYTLHRGGWVHKNISAMNIIFFPWAFESSRGGDGGTAGKPSPAAAAASLSKPFFVGLNHGREDLETAFSRGPDDIENMLKEYQHPLYLRGVSGRPAAIGAAARDRSQPPFQRFRLEFDHYSAGLVLLEIAMWTPLGKITKRIRGSPEDVQRQLLREYVPMVRSYMGDVYADCVRACMEMCQGDGSSDGSVKEKSSEDVKAEFSDKVVDRLAGCVV